MSDVVSESRETKEDFSCEQCGGILVFSPGTSHLECQYCKHVNQIPECREIQELDFEHFIQSSGHIPEIQVESIHCKSCGATTSLPPTVHSKPCPFCNHPLSTKDSIQEQWISPGAIIPFKVGEAEAKHAFKVWVNSLWYKPKGLKEAANTADRFHGLYMPYWTFDSVTEASYIGQRGTHYYVSVPYTTTVNGKSVTRTKQVRRTSWKTVSGEISHFFDDVLIPSSKRLPIALKQKLEPWGLSTDVLRFSEEYIAGFQTEKYQIDLEEGFNTAKSKMKERLTQMAKQEIGGDEQRIQSLNAAFNEIRFKYLLLPIWITTYKHGKKQYTCLVNGQTGKVAADRPYDYVKILVHLILLAGLLMALYYFFN
jgi:hypothetical protein